MQCGPELCQSLSKFSRSPADATRFLRERGFDVRPSPKFELGLNIITHVLVLFTALTLLFLLVVSKTETDALQGETISAIETHLRTALQKADVQTNGQLKTDLRLLAPALSTIKATVNKPDQATVEYNRGLFRNAYLIMGIFAAVLLTMTLTMGYGAGVPTWHMLAIVLVSNLFVFIIIGGVEYMFFKHVAVHYVPTKPSLLTDTVLDSFKKAFV